LYLVALTREPLAASDDRFGNRPVQQRQSGSRFLTVVTDHQFSRFAEHGDQYRVSDTIVPITTSPAGLLRSEVTLTKDLEKVHVSMSPVGGATVYHVADTQGNFYCSTRISLLRDAGVPIVENRAVLPELFCYTYVTPPNTMYENVKRLLLGSRVSFEIKDGRFEVASQTIYLPTSTESRGTAASLEEATVATLEAMTEEVRKLRPLEGQVAVPMSGGIDSSILWALCNRELGIRSSNSTGYPFENPERDTEKEYALSAAKALGAEHDFFEMTTGDYLRAIVEGIAISEDPIHMQAALFQRQYATGLPSETRVLVSGQGADGINGFRLQAKLFAARRNLSTRWVTANPVLGRRIARTLRAAKVRAKRLDIAVGEHLPLGDPDNTIWTHEKYGNEEWVQRYFGTTREQTIQGRYDLVSQFGDHDIYDRLAMLYLYSDIAVAGAIWAKIAEAHGRGMFYPFTAFSVMDAPLSIPWDVKLAELKKVLRGVARLLDVPEFILTRPKSGLGISPDRWGVPGGPLEPLIALTRGHFDIDVIRQLQKNPKRRNAMSFWCILNYAIWKRLFIDNESVDTLLDEIVVASDRPADRR